LNNKQALSRSKRIKDELRTFLQQETVDAVDQEAYVIADQLLLEKLAGPG